MVLKITDDEDIVCFVMCYVLCVLLSGILKLTIFSEQNTSINKMWLRMEEKIIPETKC